MPEQAWKLGNNEIHSFVSNTHFVDTSFSDIIVTNFKIEKRESRQIQLE